jgi:hypothetical protein
VTDLRSFAKRWNDSSRRHIASLGRPSPPRRWPFIGVFAIGLVAGAICSYAVTQRSQISLLARRALVARRQVLDQFGGVEVAKPVSVASHRSNHRRKAVVEVSHQ